MNLSDAIRAFEILLGLSLFLQTLEQWRVHAIDRVSDWAVQRTELPESPRWLRPLLDHLLQPAPARALLALRGLLAVTLMAGHLPLAGALGLMLIALVLLFRWRGAFNGGSDFMTLVGLTGLLIAHIVGNLTDPEQGWRAGLWYVALQSITSYFVSGWVKLLRPEWRDGSALPFFLDSGVYGPIKADSAYRRPRVAQACAWAFTVFEGCAPLVLLDARLAAAFCAVAALFHFLVFWFFGLNRFFWAWLATYPAILWAASA